MNSNAAKFTKEQSEKKLSQDIHTGKKYVEMEIATIVLSTFTTSST